MRRWVAGALALTGAAVALGDPARALASDPALARLLRGMAALKALMAVAAAVAVWWRLGRPVEVIAGAIYVVSVATMAGVAAMIWQLSGLAVASVLFHVALLALAITALRDGMNAKKGRGP